MEDTPRASEPSIRSSKRTRAQTVRTGAGGDNNPDETSDRSDHDDSFDHFAEPPPKSKGKRTSEGASAAAAQNSDQSLIGVIKGNGKLIPQAVKFWVERYEKDSKPAMVELLMMLFEACGAKYHIQHELLDETDVDDVVVALVNLAQKGEVEDYQSSKKKEFKNFKDNLTSFWDNLVIECQNGPLFDQVLFDKCMDYIIALSCTPPRIYRQIASLMGLQLVTSLINATKMLGEQRETTQRQLNAERKKHDDGPRVESLNKRLSMTHEKITVIEEMMRKIFTGLFVHRYRDVDPEIRMSCIQSLGVWILSYPPLFLQDLYLKYLGWTLNDKYAGVRKVSVLALQNLYEVDDNVPSLGLFTERFSSRMIELADDIDISVAVCAIGLVKQLLRHQLLNDDNLGSLYDLLIDDPPEIRRAIGALVYEHLIAQKFNSSQPRSRGEENDSSEVHLGRMLQILREFSTDQILSTYVIDDVWEYMDAMKDWKCISSMLLDENPQIELTDDDATNLIRLLSASVKKAVGEKIVPATDNRKQYHNKAQKEMIENNRRDVTISMMKRYPQLLRKFMADKSKIAPLVDIIVYMNLELYSLKRQEQSFKMVLQLVKEAFLKHGEKDSLRSCVKAINFCSTESRGELQDFAQNKLKELEDELIAKLKSAMGEVADGEDEYSLLVNSKRLYELQLSRSFPIGSLYEDMAVFLQSFRNIDDEVVSFLLLNMYLHVVWCLQSIINSETVSEASLSSLLSKRTTLIEHLEYYLQTPPEVQVEVKHGNQLVCRVCTIFAELWCLFRKTNFASTKLENLGYCPNESVLQKFWRLCEQQLNISDETEDEDIHKEYVEETNRQAIMIAAAKLIANDTVPEDYLGPEIVSHFVMHGTSVAEIVKHLIAVLKKKNDDVSNIFLEALKRAYHRHMMVVSESNDGSLAGKSFKECKDLAARLSGTFVGAARNKHRSVILKIVKDGIEYAFVDAPKQLSFLDGAVVHFVSKLPTPDILEIKVKEAWDSKRDVLIKSGSFAIEQLSEALSASANSNRLPDGLSQKALELCAEQLSGTYDSKFGGFGSAPKFPRPVDIQLMLYQSKKLEETGNLSKAKEGLQMVLFSLQCMAKGGVHDHIGGGFHRYSVDECWHVPHFEKMLYDQGQLANVYLDAFSITKDVYYSCVSRDILDYLRRGMMGPSGEIFSAEDADSAESEGTTRKKEGAFYIWTSREVEDTLQEHATLFKEHYYIKPSGNCDLSTMSDPDNEFKGQNVLIER